MQKELIEKKVEEFLESEKGAEGRELSKAFKQAFISNMTDIIFDEVKTAIEELPMRETIPESDASVISDFDHDVGDRVCYIVFKQVRNQPKQSLQVRFGWQYDVLEGKVEEIQIRADRAVCYKVNGAYILSDHVFKLEAEAVARANELNEGTDAFIVEAASKEAINV